MRHAMKYKYAFLLMLVCAVASVLPAVAFAQTIDFEDGTDGQVIVSPVPQIVFSPTGGSNWLYGDWRALNPGNNEPKYNGPFPDGAFYSEGNFFANLGPNQNTGRITLNFEFEATFTLGYSSAGPMILEAYDDLANLIDSDSGDVNTDTGQLDFLSVEGEIAWVKVGFLGNHWFIDNIIMDEIIPCTSDEECDDGLYCNGNESCNANGRCEDGVPPRCDDNEFCNGRETCDELSKSCKDGDAPECSDDGVYCNGPEICSSSAAACVSAGNPCREDEFCDEDKSRCMAPDLPEPEPGWPQGQITGGCCGCE
jgi:hypothetical protein